ncbi:MAG: DUF4870 domain-containing protein [Planctomycetota bacterium]
MNDSHEDEFEEKSDETTEEPEMELDDESGDASREPEMELGNEAEPASGEPDFEEEPETTISTPAAGKTGHNTQEGPAGAPETSTKDERTMAMLAHLLGIVAGFLGPLIIWMIKKDESEFVDDQGKEALNFQLTLLIGYAASVVLSFLCIGVLVGPAVWIVGLIFSIMGATTANKGESYRYPFNIRMIK